MRQTCDRRGRAKTRAGVALLLISAAVGSAGGCGGSKEFVAPTPPPRAGYAEQIKQAEAFAAQAQTAEREKRTDDAIALYRKAVDTYRDFPGVWNNLGLLLMEKGDALAAVEAFRTSGDLEPRDPRPPFNIGVLYEKQGWHAEAQRYYQEALARDANYLLALRRSVYLDMVENSYSPATLERTRRALLVETDPTWRQSFERWQLRLDTVLNTSKPDTGPILVPDREPRSQR